MVLKLVIMVAIILTDIIRGYWNRGTKYAMILAYLQIVHGVSARFVGVGQEHSDGYNFFVNNY